MGKGEQKARRARVRVAGQLGAEVIDAKVGVLGQEGSDLVFVLGRGDRARRVDEHPVGSDGARSRRQDRRLLAHHPSDACGRCPPPQVRARLQRSQPRARRVDQHAIERLAVARARLSGIGDPHADAGRPHAGAGPLQPSRATRMALHGDDLPRAPHEGREVGGLATRRRAQVQHPLSRRRVHRSRDEHGGSRLRHERTGAPQRGSMSVKGLVHHHGLFEPGIEVRSHRERRAPARRHR